MTAQSTGEREEQTGGSRWYVRLLSWNLHALPWSVGAQRRLSRVAQEVLSRLPDALLFQEVWTQGDLRHLTERLGTEYRVVEGPDSTRLRRRSGLLVFIRQSWTIEDVAFQPFTASAPRWRIWEADGLAGKGVQRVRIERGGRRLTLVNTHLQAEYGEPRYDDVRAAQIRELRDIVRQLPPTEPVILAGDLNTRPDEDAVLDGLLRDWVDLGRAFRERCGCGTQLHGDGRAGDWIDYVLARPSLRGQARGTDFELLRNRALDDPYSDHHGLFVTVELQQAPRRRTPLLGLLVDSPSALSRRQWLIASIQGALDLGTPDWCLRRQKFALFFSPGS